MHASRHVDFEPRADVGPHFRAANMLKLKANCLAMQARFQQKQLQEKEQKLLQLYDQQQQRAYQVVQRGSAGSNQGSTSVKTTTTTTAAAHTTSTSQGGKVSGFTRVSGKRNGWEGGGEVARAIPAAVVHRVVARKSSRQFETFTPRNAAIIMTNDYVRRNRVRSFSRKSGSDGRSIR